MSNNMTEIHDDYEICDISDEIEDTINTSDNDDKSIMKSSIVGIASGITFGAVIGVAHYNHWISLKGVIKTIGTIVSKI